MKDIYSNTAKKMNPVATPQNQPIYGKTMVQNAAGGYVFEIDMWKRLERFLILGSDSGNYYVGKQEMTLDNAKNVTVCIKADGKRTVDTIVQISDSGRAAKNDPALFALAMCASAESTETRQYALASLSKVARIGTHLFHFVEYVDKMRGWSRSLRKAISNWYLDRDNNGLALQLTKYQARDGWSHRDILRLSHPTPTNDVQLLAFKWAVEKFHQQKDKDSKNYNLEQYALDLKKMHESLPMIAAYEDMKATDNEKEILRLIREYKLPLELIPTEKRTKAVYEEVLPNLGITALVRQLPTLTKAGILGEVGNDNTKLIVSKLTDMDLLRKGRVHPIQMLLAYVTYKNGRSYRGDSEWTPIQKIVDAVQDGFYLSFGVVPPTGKRMMLGLDVSGSMSGGSVIGSEQLRPCEVTAAMSMVTARVESDYMVMGFASGFKNLGISPKQSLEEVLRRVVDNNFGSTDCSVPMNYALDHKIPIDAFVVYTDNETWAGQRNHPVEALKTYQQKMGIPAKLISVATSSTSTSIVEDTAFTMNVAGFDASAPNVISDFVTN
jgi:60 kDa SS-A/Ro ribonucleoprotein